MKRYTFKRWTIRERMYVERNYQTMGSPQIAQALNRTVVSVKRYINNNGFRRNQTTKQATAVN